MLVNLIFICSILKALTMTKGKILEILLDSLVSRRLVYNLEKPCQRNANIKR